MINLFIYIPTFERPIALSRQLETLVPQVLRFQKNVRLLVNNNNSSSSTFNQLKLQYQAENILFQSNFGNIGGNANIALGFVYSKKDEFIWLLSDNDLVQENCIEFLLRTTNNKIDFVVIGRSFIEPVTIDWHYAKGWIEPMEWGQGLISGSLFNSNTIQGSIEDAFYFHNSSFPHLAVAMSAAKKKQEVLFLQLPWSKILSIEIDNDKQPGDYSLSNLGMPLLLKLFPSESARTFAKGWANSRGYLFYLKRDIHPEIFTSSRYLLLKYGGIFMHLYLLKAKVLSGLFPLVYSLRNYLVTNNALSLVARVRRFAYWIGYR